MTDEPERDADGLPDPGPPFAIGDEIAFFPAELGPTSRWLAWDDAVIDDVSADAESVGFHFVGDPGVRRAQGMENIVRRTPRYAAWRSAWEAAFARTGDERIADQETNELSLRVLAEHPIHGPRLLEASRGRADPDGAMVETLATAGNTLAPAVLALRTQGFIVSLSTSEGRETWRAAKPDLVLIADDPLALLGLAALRDVRGPSWRATDAEIDAFLAEFDPDAER